MCLPAAGAVMVVMGMGRICWRESIALQYRSFVSPCVSTVIFFECLLCVTRVLLPDGCLGIYILAPQESKDPTLLVRSKRHHAVNNTAECTGLFSRKNVPVHPAKKCYWHLMFWSGGIVLRTVCCLSRNRYIVSMWVLLL